MAIKKVLVPVTGDSSDDEALNLACDIAKNGKGKVYALYVIQIRRDLPLDAEVSEETSKGEEVLRHVEQVGKEVRCPIEAKLLQARDLGPAVVQEAVERGIELIVMGTPYKKRFGTFTLGDTVPYILKNAPCEVLIWRGAASNGATNGRGKS